LLLEPRGLRLENTPRARPPCYVLHDVAATRHPAVLGGASPASPHRGACVGTCVGACCSQLTALEPLRCCRTRCNTRSHLQAAATRATPQPLHPLRRSRYTLHRTREEPQHQRAAEPGRVV
jgi:hypothetical protein